MVRLLIYGISERQGIWYVSLKSEKILLIVYSKKNSKHLLNPYHTGYISNLERYVTYIFLSNKAVIFVFDCILLSKILAK